MSDTPRTDAFFYERNRDPSSKAMLKLAQTLERELAAVTAERNEDQGVIAVWRGRAERAEQEREALLIELHAEMTSSPAHIYMGSCPVRERSPDDRDPDCPACRRLTEIDAAIAASKEKP